MIQHPQPTARVLEPNQIIKIDGEGMPYKKSDLKGDLFLKVKVKFPERDWLEKHQMIEKLKDLLPNPGHPIPADIVDEVTYDETASLDDFGTGEEGADEGWVDEDEEHVHPQQCAQQ